MPVGTTLHVVNRDGFAHTFTAEDGAFDLELIDGGSEATIALDTPGEHPFFCRIHPSMRGTIVVTG